MQTWLMRDEVRSADDLVSDLRRLGGVDAGDVVMVHASLRAIGPVEGRAEGVIDALDAAVSPSGTLLMTLGARDEWAWVNERPEADRAALLRDAIPFDCRVTPADPDVGVLAEAFRQRSGTVVSNHPEGRFGARGRLAAVLVEDAPWDDYYGTGSPLERLVRESGKVLRLGADLDTLTVLHYAEYLVPLSLKRRVRRHRRVSTPEGFEIRTVECLDDAHGVVDHPGEDYFAAILRDYLGTDRVSCGLVGHASSELIDAADVVEFGVAWMLDQFSDRSDSS
jgi:aminoglycoside N3'-acetyltransferase